ncbi:MAG: ribonuclease H family protein [Robiginitalea sp.]|jgi:ribonuclease HI
MAKKKRYYVVWKGKNPGVYSSWDACKAEIEGFEGALYMAFDSKEEADQAARSSYQQIQKSRKKRSRESLEKFGEPNYHSIAVDAASSGNPGIMEYRGVETRSGKNLFRQGPFPEGTNNIGEFLAIVHGLAYLRKNKSDRIIYTDSRTAISWVKKKKCNTRLKPSKKNEDLFELVHRAEAWLKAHSYKTPIVKWETRAWGEIPADFGRK